MLLNGCASQMDQGAQVPRHGLRLPHATPARTSATQANPRIANPPRMRADAAVPSAAWLTDRWPSRGRRALQSAPAASRPTRPTRPASTAPAARSAREATGSDAGGSPSWPSPHGSDHAGRPGPDPYPRDSLGGAWEGLPSTTLAGFDPRGLALPAALTFTRMAVGLSLALVRDWPAPLSATFSPQ